MKYRLLSIRTAFLPSDHKQLRVTIRFYVNSDSNMITSYMMQRHYANIAHMHRHIDRTAEPTRSDDCISVLSAPDILAWFYDLFMHDDRNISVECVCV